MMQLALIVNCGTVGIWNFMKRHRGAKKPLELDLRPLPPVA